MELIKVYPSVDELTCITNLLYCTEAGCPSIFKSESNLNLHLAKRHKKEEVANLLLKQEPVNRQYYCPDDSCIYNKSKYFKSLKLLKQHYLKVHSEKDILCRKCSKGFPTESSRNKHEEYCGTNFKCCDCEATYTCYDTLTTHGRRKKHKILPKLSYKQANNPEEVIYVVGNYPATSKPLILPKAASCAELLLLIRTNDKSSQTDIFDGQPKCKTRKTIREKRRITSIETQTSKNKQPQSCAETQTIGDYITKKSSIDVSNSSSSESLSRKSIKTQTAVAESITKSCNTSFNLNECQFSDVEKTTLGTQTLAMLSNLLENSLTSETSSQLNFEFMNSSCQTSFNENLDPFDATNFLNCNTETQTDSILNGFDLLDSDFYSNMCTQTCNFSDLEFNNTQTQTAVDDVLRSVGSQTMMTLNSGSMTICRDIAHIETQTEIAFKQMLEEINA